MLRAAIQETQDLKVDHIFYNYKANQSSQPKLEYAPWVVVDGAPLKEDAYRSDLDLFSFVVY